jgi:hypothetical protein
MLATLAGLGVPRVPKVKGQGCQGSREPRAKGHGDASTFSKGAPKQKGNHVANGDTSAT